MKKIALCYITSLMFLTGCSNNSEEQFNQFKADASSQIKSLASSLKKELSTAMQSEGPASAVTACKIKAPAITNQINSSSQLQIKRTSLQLRNQNNKPDEWEMKILNMFANQHIEGVPVSDMVYSEQIDKDGSTTFRMMKAIPVQAVCLTCHGIEQVIIDDVKSILTVNYPNDNATGYASGDLRGAFSVSQTISN